MPVQYVFASYLLVLLINPTVQRMLSGMGPQAAGPVDLQKCPQWLKDYTSFHRQTKGTEGAKYVVAVPLPITGLGDRMRAMMWAVRFAAATKRVLLAEWNHPAPLTTFWSPSDIDWTPEGTDWAKSKELEDITYMDEEDDRLLVPSKGTPWIKWGCPSFNPTARFFMSAMHTGKFFNVSNRFMVLQSNECLTSPCGVDCPSVSPFGEDAVCLWHYLFKPSQPVYDRVQAKLQELYPSGRQGGYVAVHLRLGQMVLEAKEIRREQRDTGVSELSLVLQTIACAKGLARQNRIDIQKNPLLVITDHDVLRRFTQQQGLSHVQTTDFLALHIGEASRKSVTTAVFTTEDHYTTFVDLGLLANARCLITSVSGYSHQAYLWGGGPACHMTVQQCIHSCRQHPAGGGHNSSCIAQPHILPRQHQENWHPDGQHH